MEKILIIEDDKSINEMLNKLLVCNNYEVVSAYSGTEGVLIHNDAINLILLDLMLPGKNGEDIIGELKNKYDVPIIVTSAIHEIDKKLDLFELGANDYVTKPFNNEELLARIKVHLKTKTTNNSILKFKDIIINQKDYSVICNNKEIELTKHEFDLLKVLIESPEEVHTKSSLFDLVWDDENSADDNTLNVHISKIRNKLKKCNTNEEYIETIWSIGYRMKK